MKEQVNILVKDQFDVKHQALAAVKNLENSEISLIDKVQQIEINGKILRPNIDLVFESPEDGKIYKVLNTL